MRNKIIERATVLFNRHNNSKFNKWRWGQSIWNAAVELYPDETEPLRAKDGIDCYYNNELVEEFLNKLEENEKHTV